MALLAGLLAIAPQATADTYPRQTGIKIANYTFDITLNDANNEFVVQDTVEVQFSFRGRHQCQPRSVQVQRAGTQSSDGQWDRQTMPARSRPEAAAAILRNRPGGRE